VTVEIDAGRSGGSLVRVQGAHSDGEQHCSMPCGDFSSCGGATGPAGEQGGVSGCATTAGRREGQRGVRGVGPRMEDAQRRLLHEKRARHAGEGIGTSCTCARGRRLQRKTRQEGAIGRSDRVRIFTHKSGQFANC